MTKLYEVRARALGLVKEVEEEMINLEDIRKVLKDIEELPGEDVEQQQVLNDWLVETEEDFNKLDIYTQTEITEEINSVINGYADVQDIYNKLSKVVELFDYLKQYSMWA